MDNLAKLLEEKSQILSTLDKLIFGTIEIRTSKEKKYIYVHRRNDGLQESKYVGEFSNELYNLILENNKLAKELKSNLKSINKSLKELNYVESDLSDKVELNRALAYKNLVDSIYKQAMLEGVATTYSDTETLVNGGKVNDMTVNDISKVINLKHAWEFILNKGVLQYPSNYNLLCQINGFIEDGFSVTAGKLRNINVSIGGSKYIPPIPFESQVKEQLAQILNIQDVLERAIKSLLFIMKKQLFLDGNKRTAVIFANHILISNGIGLIVIPAELVNDYKKLLIKYYEDDNIKDIYDFLLNKAYIKLE